VTAVDASVSFDDLGERQHRIDHRPNRSLLGQRDEGAEVVGTEKIRDKSTLHLKGEVRGETLSPMMGSTVKPELIYPVDLWMDERSGDTVQVHVTEPAGNGWLIEMFGTNQPVEIPTPQLPPATPKP